MKTNATRREFISAATATAAVVGLAACDSSSDTETEESTENETEEEESETETTDDTNTSESESTLPSADDYPIDVDGDDVEALWTSEETRDGWTRVTNPDDGAEIGVMDTTRIIQVDGLAFRDMNGNGQLDMWEDWRQSDEDRASALAEELTAEQILPLMWHNGLNNTTSPLPDDDVELIDEGLRAGVSRYQADGDSYAGAISWMNAVQEACEQSENGIPYMNSTDQYQLFGIPDNDGLAASMDMDLVERVGNLLGQAWRATGVRCLLGPQIDVGSNPNWTRYSGTVSEDPALNRDFAKAFISGLQSTYDDDGNDTGWGSESVLGMAKHYCGTGASEGGRNDHYDTGKYNVFPGDNYEAHFVPFIDGALNLESETGEVAAIMPNYGTAYDEDQAYGDNVGGAYSTTRINYLRNAGWDGMITTDWGITGEDSSKVAGVETLTVPERQLILLKNSIDQIGGEFDVDNLTEAYDLYVAEVGEDEALSQIRNSARRIFTNMLRVDLFDEPYSDREIAAEIFDSEESTNLGIEAGEKSLIMLKNSGNVINSEGLGDGSKVYVRQKLQQSGGFTSSDYEFVLPVDEELMSEHYEIITDTIADEPTGEVYSFFTGEVEGTTYQQSDATMPSEEELADVDYGIVFISGPELSEGYTEDDDGNITYTPISIQYREYTADGSSVRTESIAGNIEGSEDNQLWDSTTGGTKENRSYYGQTTTTGNEDELDLVISIREALPDTAKLIVVVQAASPFCVHELEPYADVLFVQFYMSEGVNTTSFVNILTGDAEPSALLPCQMPADMDAVEAQCEDVPRDMDCYVDSDGNTYDFCFGLNWSGVIEDDRVATYNVDPLTAPETAELDGESY